MLSPGAWVALGIGLEDCNAPANFFGLGACTCISVVVIYNTKTEAECVPQEASETRQPRENKETTMLKMNLKAMASGFAALALTLVLSWTFVDATSIARVHRDGGPGALVAAISALVR
jgi:hypothetical protein